MRVKLSLAVILTALGIVLMILGGKEFETEKEVFRIADFRATVPAKKTYPVADQVGRGLTVCGLFFAALCVFERVRRKVSGSAAQ